MKNTLSIFIICILFFAVDSWSEEDNFSKIKQIFTESALIRFNMTIVTVSEIFDEMEGSMGDISLADDGRYLVHIADDIYLYDGRTIWEYSAENNQALRRQLKENEQPETQLTFIKRLDSYYDTKTIVSNSIYFMLKHKKADDALPDSMTIYLDSTQSFISKIEYYDLNQDLNQIFLSNQKVANTIDSNLFMINLPDSVEIISLP